MTEKEDNLTAAIEASGRPMTDFESDRKQIESLALHDEVIYRYMQYAKIQNWTWEVVLQKMVIFLAEDRKHLQERSEILTRSTK